MKRRFVIISVGVHVLFLVMVGPYLYTRMEFDKEEEANRTEEVRKRELERQEYEKAKREEQQLTELQARKLKREATRKKQEELEKELQRLRELREEIAEKRKEALRKIESKTFRIRSNRCAFSATAKTSAPRRQLLLARQGRISRTVNLRYPGLFQVPCSILRSFLVGVASPHVDRASPTASAITSLATYMDAATCWTS